MKSRYLMSCAVAAVVTGAAHTAAFAQETAASAAPTSPGEIIVTATRRSESLQKVPLTIQAFTGDTLKQLNVVNFTDLLKYTPNVTYGNNGPGAGSIFMRGLSTGFAGSQSASTTGVFPQRRALSRRSVDAIPVAQRRHLHGRHGARRSARGPQGTLFGGGAEAGAVRYITNKPDLEKFSGHFEGSAGGTVGGAPNGSFNATINLPVIQDKLAVRAVIYDDHRGGYIDNVPGTFTRSASDHYANYLGNGTQSGAGQYNNASEAKKNYNPVDYIGGRISAKWQIDENWDLLVSEMYQKMDAEGTFNEEPYSPMASSSAACRTVTFEPATTRTNSPTPPGRSTASSATSSSYTPAPTWSAISRTQQDYTNYSRAFGEYYQCTGSGTGIGKGAPTCYDPYSYWHDKTRSTHLSNELRISSPDDKRFRVIGGAFYEKFRIYDNIGLRL